MSQAGPPGPFSARAQGTPLAVDVGVVTLDDFTAMAPGSDVPLEGRVTRCPQCGRNGIEHLEPDGVCVVHVQESEVLSDGMLIQPRDCYRATRPADGFGT